MPFAGNVSWPVTLMTGLPLSPAFAAGNEAFGKPSNPAFLLAPADAYLYRFYGEGLSTFHLSLVTDSSPLEMLEYLGSGIWPMLGVAGLAPAAMDMVQIYDCYTITVLMTLEDAGFCGKGEGGEHQIAHRRGVL